MNDLQIFENPSFGQIRTINQDNEPWFAAPDVCRALDLDPTATRRLDDDEKALHSMQTLGGTQEMTIINEPGLYSLVLGSRKPEAKAFKRWITHEVIPAIRKTGTYSTGTSDKLLRAQAMLMNAQTRQFNAIMKSIPDKTKLSAIAVEVFGIKALGAVTGAPVGDYLPQTEKHLSATEVGKKYGVTAARVGRLANENGMKTAEFGITVMDKSPYSSKQVETFRYNGRGVERIGQLLGVQ